MPLVSKAGLLMLVAPILSFALLKFEWPQTHSSSSGPPSGGNPYVVLGVSRNTNQETVAKAYRALAKRWHPDRAGGDEAIFATVAHAYNILTDPAQRDVFDRLGERGLERLRDGDPSVRPDYLPPDEVLRRIHNDGEEEWLASVVTASFATLGSFMHALDQWLSPTLRWITATESPSCVITAMDASGVALASGMTTTTGVTFKFVLSGKSLDFEATDVANNCPARSRFLGMKNTYYLECQHEPGLLVSVSVAENTFTVSNRPGPNLAAGPFRLEMI